MAILTFYTMLTLASSECSSNVHYFRPFIYCQMIQGDQVTVNVHGHSCVNTRKSALFGTCTYNIHKLWACTFHYASFLLSFHSSSPYDLYIGHEIHMVIELQQTCLSVTRFHYVLQSSIYSVQTWSITETKLHNIHACILCNFVSIKQKAQLKRASTVCGVKGQYSNVRQDQDSYIMASVKAGWDHTC